MKILWVSSIAWKKNSEYPYPVNGAGAVSGSLFQQTMIHGLEQLGHSVDIVSDYPFAPGSNTHKGEEWSHNGIAADIYVKTLDIPYVSLLHKAKALKNAVKEKLKNNKYDVAMAYLIHQPYLDAVSYAKELDPEIKTVLICPDLPNMMDMSLSQKKLKAFLKKIDKVRIERLYKKIDGFVLFAKAMQDEIKNEKAKFSVIEGVATIDDLDITPVQKEKFVMYAGTLHPNIGIENIIEAMRYVEDKEIKLKIYGTGALEEYVKDKAKQDSRIIYGGFIEREALFEEQKKAFALINARNPQDAFTKYSFPSKTFEYLYSGTPFVTTELEGVPKEYKEHLFNTENNSPQAIAKVINEICLMDSDAILEHGINARRFIVEEKTMAHQSKKLELFTKSLFKEIIDEHHKEKR